MEFSKKKLPRDAISQLFRVSIETVRPFVLTLGPTYVLLKENEKFVAVKAPLDFFTPKELQRLAPYQDFYVPTFVKTLTPFIDAGRRVKAILSVDPESSSFEAEVPYYQSDRILKEIGPLWWNYPGQGPAIEPFLVAVFVNEVCEPIPDSILLQSRDFDAEAFEKAVFKSSWAVFLALHLGYCDSYFLSQLRYQVFEETSSGKKRELFRNEIDELVRLVHESLRSNRLRLLKNDFFKKRVESVSQKLASRFEIINDELIGKDQEPPSVFGDGGFIDV